MNTADKYFKKYTVPLFAIITLVIMFLRVPFWDETHSFEIASCSLKEIFSLTRIEGHPILWYLVLKPFTCLKLYPYSMFIINWLFCFFAIYVLNKYTPFSGIIKFFITFSTPFLLYFAPVARCYAIGIFFIFLLCAYFPYRFKKPYIYSILIVLASQTSLMAMIGVFYLGLIYLFEIFYRYKKKLFSRNVFIVIFSIFLFAALFTILEFIGLETPKEKYTLKALGDIFYFIIFPKGVNLTSSLLRLTSSVLFYISPFVLYKYSKKGMFFIYPIYLTLAFVFVFINIGSYWNNYFFYVYFIVLFWTYGRKLLKIKFVKYLFIIIVFFMTLPYAVQNGTVFDFIYSSKSNLIADYILKNIDYKNNKLYVLEWWSDISPGANIYLKKNNVRLYNKNNIEKGSYEDLKNIFKLRYELIDFDKFISNAPNDFYILSDGNILNQKFNNCIFEKKDNMDLIIKTENNKYLLKQIDNQKKNLGLVIYKVIKI